MNEKFCCYCAHLVGRRTLTETADGWSCHAKDNLISTSQDLVTGATIYHLRFTTCYEARSSEEGCGSQGMWFEEYVHIQSVSGPYKGPKVVGGMRMTADALLAELENIGEKKDG